MRRLLMMVPIAALAVTGFVPAQADDAENTPIVIACVGTAGHEGAYWRANSLRVDVPPPAGVGRSMCAGWAPDTARPLGPPPPPPDPNPTTPDDYFWWLEKWMGPSTPFFVAAGDLQLTGAGDFSCGNGTLERAASGKFGENYIWTHQGPVHQSSWIWRLDDWSATFADGVGEVAGTATRTGLGMPDQETRSLSGYLLVNDGAAYGQCDDSAGASQFVAVFVLE